MKSSCPACGQLRRTASPDFNCKLKMVLHRIQRRGISRYLLLRASACIMAASVTPGTKAHFGQHPSQTWAPCHYRSLLSFQIVSARVGCYGENNPGRKERPGTVGVYSSMDTADLEGRGRLGGERALAIRPFFTGEKASPLKSHMKDTRKHPYSN